MQERCKVALTDHLNTQPSWYPQQLSVLLLCCFHFLFILSQQQTQATVWAHKRNV
jgi:hypothetical protein